MSAARAGSLAKLARAALAMPPGRLWARLVHESRRRAQAALPRGLRERLAGVGDPAPPRRPGYLAAMAHELSPGPAAPSLTVEILGHPHTLAAAIDWEPAGKSRLWLFTLHYFDWAVAAVGATLARAAGPEERVAGSAATSAVARAAFEAMRSWVEAEPYGRYDAWHPYPTAKRLVSWTYLFAAFPELATPDLESSHWLQARHLARSLEKHAGGNHLLMDLCALVVAGLRYDGREAEALVERALRELVAEVPRQVTADGCHVELAAAYHLQVLAMLSEASLCLSSAGLATPAPLVSALEALSAFAERMRLPDGSYPLWSDTSRDTTLPLDEALALARGALAAAGGGTPSSGQLRFPYAPLVAAAGRTPERRPLGRVPSAPFAPQAPASGYHLLRGDGLVAVFDGADTGAHGMPGHGHADCLNVDVHTAAGPLIVESGTSTYDPGPERDRERGTAAHDTVVVAGRDQTEMWDAFRVGRPARAFDRSAGITQGWAWAQAAHDGYAELGVTHRRWVGVRGGTVVVLDALDLDEGAEPLPFGLRYHLAPGVEARGSGGVLTLTGGGRDMGLAFAGLVEGDAVRAVPAGAGASYYAERFGHRTARGLVEVTGKLAPGRRYVATVISPGAAHAELRRQGGTVELVAATLPSLTWRDAPGPLVLSTVIEEVTA